MTGLADAIHAAIRNARYHGGDGGDRDSSTISDDIYITGLGWTGASSMVLVGNA